MPQSLQQYLRSFFCHDITNLNAANSEMFRVNTFVNFLLSFIVNRENKQAGEEIHRPLQKHGRTGKEYGCFPFV